MLQGVFPANRVVGVRQRGGDSCAQLSAACQAHLHGLTLHAAACSQQIARTLQQQPRTGPKSARQAVGPASGDAHAQQQGTLSSDASPAAESSKSQAALSCCPGQPAQTPLKSPLEGRWGSCPAPPAAAAGSASGHSSSSPALLPR